MQPPRIQYGYEPSRHGLCRLGAHLTLMTDTEQLMAWLKEGEHQTLDFKHQIKDPAKIARNLVAFANASGGLLLVGIDDFGEIVGVDPNQEKHVLDLAAKKYCDPPLKLRYKLYETDDMNVLAVRVNKSEETHAAIDEDGNRKIFIRKDDACVSSEELVAEQERIDNNNNPIPIYTSTNEGLINYLKSNHTISIKQYMQLMDLPFPLAKKSLERLRHAGILNRHRGQHYPYYTLMKES